MLKPKVEMSSTVAYLNSTNSSDIVNVSNWKSLYYVLTHLAPFSLTVDRYVTPIWCSIGVLGNLVSIRIWTLRRMRKCNSSAAYLATLAVSDCLFLILIIGNELQYPWMVGALNLQGWCQMWNVLQITCQYTSILLVFAFTVERFISVCRPFSCEKFSKTSRWSKITGAILCTSFILALPQAFFWDVSNEIRECALRGFFDDFYVIWNWASELVMFGVVPIFAFILNICVLKQIRTVGRLFITSETLHRHTGPRCSSTTATLMWISFYLIFSKLPVTIMFIMQSSVPFGNSMSISDMRQDRTWQNYLSYYTARKIIEELGISHHACNIFIYTATSKQFRTHLKLFLVQIFSRKGTVPRSSPSHSVRQRRFWLQPKT